MNALNDMLTSVKMMENRMGNGKVIISPIFQKIQECKEPIIIYGAGALGHEVYNTLYKHHIVPHFFCSGLHSGYIDEATGIKVIGKSDLTAYRDCILIFAIGDTASKDEKNQLRKDVIEMGFKEELVLNHSCFEEKVSPSFILDHKREIADVFNLLSDEESKKIYLKKLQYMVSYLSVDFESNQEMYIDDEIIKFNQNEIIIDAGAYSGDTALLFRKVVGENAIIYSFEPDKANYTKMIGVINRDSKIHPENLGLWKNKDILCLSDDNNGSSHIQEDGVNKVEVTDLDSFCNERSIVPTYIKMDIEGVEYEALEGSKEILKKYYPKLAVCLYHKPEDIFKLPLLIHEINPNYKFYIRHYSDYRTDTLLYAIPM